MPFVYFVNIFCLENEKSLSEGNFKSLYHFGLILITQILRVVVFIFVVGPTYIHIVNNLKYYNSIHAVIVISVKQNELEH